MESQQIFGEVVVFWLGALPVTVTMLTSLAVSVALVLAALGLRAGLARSESSTPAALALLSVEWIDDLVRQVAGRADPVLVTLAGSLFAFIAACNLSGQLPGVRPPTASLATTSALAVLVFLAVPAAGIRARGLRGYLLGYFRPNPLFAPLHILSELSRTLALSMRLFGNMMSGHLVVALLVALTGFLVPMPLMALDVLIGLLQAYIFTVLAVVYVGAAVRSSEG
jgi:F-type H+-transporting ATPase subunit a